MDETPPGPPIHAGRSLEPAAGTAAWIAAAATVGAAVVATGLVWRFAVDVPRWDEWEFAGFLARAAHGESTVGDWFAQYNEHRMVVPRAVMLAFARATNWNLRWQALLAPAVALATLALLARVGAHTVPHRPARRTAVAISALLIFSPAQEENWMMALQHVFFVPGACLAAALALAVSSRPWWARWGGSAVLAALASFSVASGFLVWMLAWPALWWPPDPAQQRGRVAGTACWCAAAAACAALFFHGYVAVQEHPALATPFSDGARFWGYFTAFLGAPFGRGTAVGPLVVARLSGALLAAAYVAGLAWAVRVASRRAVPWLAWGGLALASATSAAALRSGFGDVQALASRYATFAFPLAMAVVWLGALAWAQRARRPSIPSATTIAWISALGGALMVLLALSSARAVQDMARTSMTLSAARAALPFVGHLPDTTPLEILYPLPDRLQELALPLWDQGWLRPPRRRDAVLPAPGDVGDPGRGAGWLERAEPAPDGAVRMEGWAMIPGRRTPADLVVIAGEGDDGTIRALAFGTMHPERRKDYLGLPGDPRRRSAWAATIGRDAVPAGSVVLTAWAIDADSGRAFRLRGEHRLAGADVDP